MAAAVLGDGASTIHNIPVLKDVATFSNVIRVTGCTVDWSPDDDPSTPDSIRIDASGIHHFEAPYDLVKQMRASFYMLGALLGRGGKARVSLPGGCAWGPRPVDLHIKGMEALGATVEEDAGYVIAEAPGGRLAGGRVRFDPVSVGATVNVLLAAVTARGESVLENVAAEPDVVVFGEMLQKMGARIEGLGTDTIHVQGVDSLEAVEFTNCPDRIELGTYMIAAALSTPPGETFRITGTQPEHLGDAFTERFRETGVPFEVVDDPDSELGYKAIDVTGVESIKPVSIVTDPFPGFATDLQAQWTVMMTQAEGDSTVRDTIYTDRFKHIPELRRLGAQLRVEGDTVHVQGRPDKPLSGATVMSTDLRASVSLVLAGMVAQGRTDVLRVYHLDRGYERLEGKLQRAGIEISREQYDEAHAEAVAA